MTTGHVKHHPVTTVPSPLTSRVCVTGFVIVCKLITEGRLVRILNFVLFFVYSFPIFPSWYPFIRLLYSFSSVILYLTYHDLPIGNSNSQTSEKGSTRKQGNRDLLHKSEQERNFVRSSRLSKGSL